MPNNVDKTYTGVIFIDAHLEFYSNSEENEINTPEIVILRDAT